MSKKSSAAKVSKDEPTVQGVKVEKVKIALINKALKDAGIEIGEMSATEKVEALQFHNKKAAGDKATCGVCGGVAPEDLEACPFCGDEGVEDDAKTGKRAKLATVTSLAVVKEKAGKIVPKGVLRFEPVEMTEKALNEITERAKKIGERAKHDYWDMGRVLGTVYESSIWKLRTKGGKPVYTSFNQYVAAEIGVHPQTAFNMIDVAKAFPESKIKEIGGSKLSLVLKAPEAERDSIMKEIEAGAGHRQVKAKVDKARKKHKVIKRDTGRKKMPVGKQTKKRIDGRMTVAMVEATKSFELWAKPAKKLKEGEKPTKRAKNLGDEPWAIEKLANNVERIYSIVHSSQGWKLKIETRRIQ